MDAATDTARPGGIEIGAADAAELRAWRHDLHRHPELAFEEHRTAALVSDLLEGMGIAVTRGIAGTGVVGALDGALGPGPAIALRADMDALPIAEESRFAHRSVHAGRMHACGHDGHVAMLLGAARALSRRRAFRGRVVFVFQPAEENEGGGRAMVEDGLFERFPVDACYGLHNWPGLEIGHGAVHDAEVMAAFDTFSIELRGRGGHAAMPHQCSDLPLAASRLVADLQGVTSREVASTSPAVLSVTAVHAGATFNVMPDRAELMGTTRFFDVEVGRHLARRLRDVVRSACELHGLEFALDHRTRYPATVNDPHHASLCADAMRRALGDGSVRRNPPPSMAAEDFAFMLGQRPGAYVWLGNGLDSAPLHHPRYDFDDDALIVGVRYWLELVAGALR